MLLLVLAFVAVFGTTPVAAGDSHKVWTIKTEEDVKSPYFLNNGKIVYRFKVLIARTALDSE